MRGRGEKGRGEIHFYRKIMFHLSGVVDHGREGPTHMGSLSSCGIQKLYRCK